MHNFLVSLYLTVAMLFSLVLPACAYNSELPNCCKELINICSMQNQCCCCDTLPADQASSSIQAIASNTQEFDACFNSLLV